MLKVKFDFKDKPIKDIPFVFITAHGDKEDLKNRMQRGASHYLIKPFLMSELILAVGKYISR